MKLSLCMVLSWSFYGDRRCVTYMSFREVTLRVRVSRYGCIEGQTKCGLGHVFAMHGVLVTRYGRVRVEAG